MECPQGPLSGIAAQYPAGQWVGLNGGRGARYILGSMRKRWRYGQSPAGQWTLLRCLTCSTKSHQSRSSAASRSTEHNRHTQMPRCDCGPECPCRHTAAQECQVMEARYTQGQSPQRSRPILEISGLRIVATGDRISPQKPRRNEPSHGLQANHCKAVDALCKTTRSASLGARLRMPGCGDPNPCRDPQRLHSSWYTANRDPRLNPSGVRGSMSFNRFMQHM